MWDSAHIILATPSDFFVDLSTHRINTASFGGTVTGRENADTALLLLFMITFFPYLFALGLVWWSGCRWTCLILASFPQNPSILLYSRYLSLCLKWLHQKIIININDHSFLYINRSSKVSLVRMFGFMWILSPLTQDGVNSVTF